MPSSPEEAFFEKARNVHGDRYDYTEATYRNSTTKLTVRCRLHGLFYPYPSNHLRGTGCRKCADLLRSQGSLESQEEFLAKARAVHGDRYDYSGTQYVGAKKKITIQCFKHGPFTQTANSHLAGHGCARCGFEEASALRTQSTEEFIQAAQAMHGAATYSYASTRYTRSSAKVDIECPRHGVFQQVAFSHLRGHGCPQCGIDSTAKDKTLTQEEFLRRATSLHEGKYTYEGATYTAYRDKVSITCPDHGIFLQAPDNHLHGTGCPKCVHHYSKLHQEVEAYLTEMGCTYESNQLGLIAPYELDTVVTGHRLAIECNGVWWHSLTPETLSRKNRHREKFELCSKVGISLLQIPEMEWRREVTQKILKSIIASKLGRHTKVAARTLTFAEVSYAAATVFLAQHHLQGATKDIRWAFGLYSGDDLVAVMTFALHQKTQINLTRLAFKRGITVVGGSQKLFKNAVKHLPPRDIVTFSDNGYSNGDIYPVLGFKKDKDLPPSYQWFFRNTVYNKRQCRHKYLPSVLGDAYRPEETEHQNMFRAGARCLYDAGYQRWVYRP